MPDEAMWEGFFDAPATLVTLGLTEKYNSVVEFGCGYGTFTLAVARIAGGIVYALDIEPDMIKITQAKAVHAKLDNVRAIQRDFVKDGTGFPEQSMDFAMLFNILHAEEPLLLLHEAHRVLRSGGILAITHWNYDPATPRGPSMDIRPRPEQCREWAESAGFFSLHPGIINLPPYHYGLALQKPE